MTATGTAMVALERNWEMVDLALADLDDEVMARQPNGQSNSVSWLLWHMSRVVDRFVNSRFLNTQLLWVKDGWHQKFGMPPDPDDFGMGWTAAQVSAWRPPAKNVLLEYYEAVKSSARDYLPGVTAFDLERQIPFSAPLNTVSLGDALGVLVWDNIVHGGQIAYLRGYYQGMGWHR